MSTLSMDFAGEVYLVHPPAELTFGRDADIEIDTNPYLHRRLGRFCHEDGSWWLYNTGSATSLEICDQGSSSRISVAPGAAVPLPFRAALLRFQAGPTTYQIELTCDTTRRKGEILDDAPGETTMTAANVALNLEQHQLLLALAELRLLDRGAAASKLPTNRQAAARLGWSMPKFNRKLDHLCSKFDKLGVAGLKGDVGQLASARREQLVAHGIRVRLLRAENLHLLDGEAKRDDTKEHKP